MNTIVHTFRKIRKKKKKKKKEIPGQQEPEHRHRRSYRTILAKFRKIITLTLLFACKAKHPNWIATTDNTPHAAWRCGILQYLLYLAISCAAKIHYSSSSSRNSNNSNNNSLSPDPFFASLFSFLFVRDTNLAHPIKNCSLHSLV